MHDPVYNPADHGKPVKIFSCTDEVLAAISCGLSYNRNEHEVDGRRCDELGRGLNLTN